MKELRCRGKQNLVKIIKTCFSNFSSCNTEKYIYIASQHMYIHINENICIYNLYNQNKFHKHCFPDYV